MKTTERFPLTSGPKEFDPTRKTAFFRSGNVHILFVVKQAKTEADNSITYLGETRVRGLPKVPAVANFRLREQQGWINYP